MALIAKGLKSSQGLFLNSFKRRSQIFVQNQKLKSSSMTKESSETYQTANVVRLTDVKVKSAATLASKLLTEGKVIALPTDTVYGIAALVQNKEAVKKLYDIKGRDSSKPVAICVAEVANVFDWCVVTVPVQLLARLLPGPVTLCFKKFPELNPEFNPGAPLVGIRIPDYPFIREVCRQASSPLALTSANVSSAGSTLDISEFENLFPSLAAIFDGGRLGDTPEARQGSTVVDLSTPGFYRIVRAGSAKLETVKILQEFHLQEI